MTAEEISTWLESEVAANRMLPEQADDLTEQKSLFDERRDKIERDFRNKCVGFVAGEMLVHESVQCLSEAVKVLHPGRPFYFEPVGFALFEEH